MFNTKPCRRCVALYEDSLSDILRLTRGQLDPADVPEDAHEAVRAVARVMSAKPSPNEDPESGGKCEQCGRYTHSGLRLCYLCEFAKGHRR